ncbi:MgtC/SapB family protein [Isoalcanivorax beigongshangi]|uniref:Protein MgtC n=1 Tax=Isoalcanivorax beigongshangi TaxID=3238810 RepID=A0ABV4AEU4_9GAMM
MQSIANINLMSLADTTVSLLVAFVLGGIIGLERQVRQRTAGLRTNVLVCVGAALFVDVGVRFFQLHGGTPSPLHIVAYVVSGVGFLGAGVIMREEGNVRGINTAATLWGSAAVGTAAGADLILEALLGALFVLAANTLLRPVVNRIDRQPIDVETVEATYTVCVITPREHRDQALALLETVFETANIPLRDVDINPFGEEELEIEAVLVPTSISGDLLDSLTARLRRARYVSQAFSTASTSE